MEVTLPAKALFTIPEAAEHLALHRMSVYRLINEGQLTRVYPRPRSARITRESLVEHLARSHDRQAVTAAYDAAKQTGGQKAPPARRPGASLAPASAPTPEKKPGLLARWGLSGDK